MLNRKYVMTAGVAAILLTGATPGFAGSCYEHSDKSAANLMGEAKKLFQSADINNDNALTKAEHGSAGLDKFGVAFRTFDVDSDNIISWDEYKTVFSKHHKNSGSDA